MRILFIGSVKFSFYALEHLLRLQDSKIVGVCTLTHSDFNSDHTDLSDFAIKSNIPVWNDPNLDTDASLEWMGDKNPDVIFCFGWSKLLGNSVLRLSRLGVIGYHPAALPANRGRHPLIWALALGLKETASTFFFMDEGADSGDILSQHHLLISPQDDAESLYKKIVETALMQITEFVPALANGKYQRLPQDHTRANYWRKRNTCDGIIDWRMSAKSIHNLVRALSKPYVGASFVWKNEEIKVWKTVVVDDISKNLEFGKVLSINNRNIKIKTGFGSIVLLDHEIKILPKVGSYLI